MRHGAIVWSWRNAVFGLLISLGGAVTIALGSTATGLALLLGSLPAASIGLLATRHARRALVVVGVLFGAFMMLGGLLAQSWLTAVLGMFGLAFGACWLGARRPLGQLGIALCVPIAGVGLSYSDLASAVRTGLLLAGGSVIAYLWSLALPEYPRPLRSPRALMSADQARDYGVRLGLAGAVAAGVGFALGTEHVGWIAGATLFVMRPSREMQRLRSVGRAASVLVGASVAAWTLSLHPGHLAIAVVAASALVAAAALHGSRWYVIPAFSTFLVLWVLLYDNDTTAGIEHRFAERTLDTLCGLAIAFVFGVALPTLSERSARRRRVSSAP
ncbi:fusaric acid resistance family protein [Jatrophihabitans sp. GAS493]|nr:fusaric acid resistance family protein [Jatrophihabitans sp. GAS493]